MTKDKFSNGASFLGSVIKFSVSTWVNACIVGLSLILGTRFLGPEVYGDYDVFANAASTIMVISAIGLDQAYMRFYNEPP
ncbi:MAG: teichoic acid transporter, partial [Ruminococcaceae bacterium]|nr:teichoic acid transporter [Oscillospiraceae bacterium]